MQKNEKRFGKAGALLKKAVLASAMLLNVSAFAGVDLYIRDNVGDAGAEPNTTTSTFYESPDIWVRQDPIPGYSPNAFPASSPPSWIASYPNQAAEYREPFRFSKPNWIYVKVTNRGSSTSLGTEVVHVYWAKASTGLSWPSQWVDYVTTWGTCTAKLLGQEVTKPRQNVSYISSSERTRYLNAVLALDATFYGDGVSWWDKQDKIHEATHVHGGSAFLPWHRELINRYELLMREMDPLVRLHYWDWTTDPRTNGSVNLMTSSFMGTDYGTVCTPFACGTTPFSTDGDIERYLPSSGAPSVSSDAYNTTFGNSDPAADQWYDFRLQLEGDHNTVHGYIGGTIGDAHTAFQDPFVYLLHSDVDRLFAMWQRDPSWLYRLDPANVYGNEGSSSPITDDLQPWAGGGLIATYPWTTAGGDIYVKTSKDPSVVSPPVYDNVQLTVPKLGPGESCVLQVQWYPPNPAGYTCFGLDKSHFCLLARIVASGDPMYTAETTTTWYNAQQNNNIAWKNITVLDQWPNSARIAGVTVRNILATGTPVRLTFHETSTFTHDGTVKVDLGPALYQNWVAGGKIGENVEITAQGGTTITLTSPDAWIGNIKMGGNEFEPVNLNFDDITVENGTGEEVYMLNMDQYNETAQGTDYVGGEKFEVTLKVGDPPSPPPAEQTTAIQTPMEYFNTHTYVYPNPAKTQINISVRDNYITTYSLDVKDITGKSVFSTKFNGEYVLNLEGFTNGIYLAEITDLKTSNKITKRFTVTK